MTGTKVTIGAAALAGMLLAAAMPGGFALDAWLFGVLLGLGQSVFGLRAYRVAISRRTLALGPALASGFIRIAVLLAAFAAALAMGYPAAPFAWSMLMMYAAMMVAEIAFVARITQQPAMEAC